VRACPGAVVADAETGLPPEKSGCTSRPCAKLSDDAPARLVHGLYYGFQAATVPPTTVRRVRPSRPCGLMPVASVMINPADAR